MSRALRCGPLSRDIDGLAMQSLELSSLDWKKLTTQTILQLERVYKTDDIRLHNKVYAGIVLVTWCDT